MPCDALKQKYLTKESEITMLGFALLHIYESTSVHTSEEGIDITINGKAYNLKYPQLNSTALDHVLREEYSKERAELHKLLMSMVDEDPANRPDVDTCLEQLNRIRKAYE